MDIILMEPWQRYKAGAILHVLKAKGQQLIDEGIAKGYIKAGSKESVQHKSKPAKKPKK